VHTDLTKAEASPPRRLRQACSSDRDSAHLTAGVTGQRSRVVLPIHD